jgi:ABC-type Mn2+/Zn2+ transport system ATPase subunit
MNGANGNVVVASGLSVGYERRPVVPGIELALGAGATLALVGTNGSGKSTLLKTLAGLLPGVSGSLRVFGGPPGRFPSRVAYLSQFNTTNFILPLRTADVVRMGRFSSLGLFGRATKRDERLVREAMERMGVADLAEEPLNALSGGQRQRVFLAQALARDAELLLLDEPEANLDAEGKETYRRVVRENRAAGRTLIIATHDISDASSCDWTMLLARRVVAYGRGGAILTPDALLETFGVTVELKEGKVVVVECEHGHDCVE